MLYLLAAIVVVALAVVLWQTMAKHQVSVGAKRRVTGPDDDPDFLRRLGEQIQRGDRPEDSTDS